MADRTGQQLGNYRLTRLLGKGGSADVYLGAHLYLKRQAAIKVLHASVEEVQRQYFLEEAQRLLDLSHPHIVRILDFAVEGDIPFLVMEYAPNGTLRTRHPRGVALPLTTIISYVKQIASALQYIHERKLIHRDIKPENILLDAQQNILLSDFGIASIAYTTGSLMLQGLAGTPPYMAPEQLQGKPRPASDQYALGIMTYEWLCGEYPFQGSAFEIATQHVVAPIPSLQKRSVAISPAIEHVVFTALAKDPLQRFANVQNFADALEQAYQMPAQTNPLVSYRETAAPSTHTPFSTQPVSALSTSEPPPVKPLGQPSSPIPTQNSLSSLSLPAPSLQQKPPALVNPYLQPPLYPKPSLSEPFSPSSSSANPPMPQPASSSSSSLKLGGRFLGLSIRMRVLLFILVFVVAASGLAIYLPILIGKIQPIPSATPSLVPVAHLTSIAMHAASTPSITPSATITTSGASSSYSMFGFNPQHTNYNPDEKTLSVANVSHLVLAWSSPSASIIQSAPIIANGDIYIASNTLQAFSSATGRLLWSAPNANGGGQTSPAVVNGIAYFVPSGGGSLNAFDAATGTLSWTVPAGSSIFSSPTIENGKVYIGANDGYLYAFDATTGARLWSARTNSGGNNTASLSSPAVANGIVYIGSTDNRVYAFDALTGSQLWNFPTGYKIIGSSPTVADGVVYIGSEDGSFYALNAKTGVVIWTFPTKDAFDSSPAITNGIVYTSSGSNLYALNAKTGTSLWTASVSVASYINGALTVANGVVYAGSTDHKVYAFNAATGAILWTYTTGDNVNSSPTVANGMLFVGSDDGKLYAFHLSGATP